MAKGRIIRIFLLAGLAVFSAACSKNDGNIVPPAPQGTDLSAEGYANSYIVEKGGEYCFGTRLVDGSAVDGIVSADWVWSTNDADPSGLVKNVSYSDGYISFTAGDGKGNALIAAFDADGKILWSWHIWLTEKPALQKLDNGTVFMDRNLGAMSASPEEATLTYGLKYQWGRKDPFFGGPENEDAGSVFSMARAATVFNPELAMDWTAVKRNESNGTVGYGIANPVTFIYTDKTEDGCDWLVVPDDWLWCDEQTGAKTNYDPCPAGYTVAPDGAWEGCGYWNVDDDPVNGGRVHTTETGETFWWPLSGHRWGDSDAGMLGYVGVNGTGTIWMRTTINCGYNASCFYYHQGTYTANSYAMYRAYGEEVRCVTIDSLK